MSRYLVAYLGTGLAILALDSVWLSIMANRLYRPVAGSMMIDGFRPAPAVVFYLLYVLGVVLLGVSPAFRDGNVLRALMNGALLGFFAYATYDLTNQATLKQWSTLLSVTDIAWGTILSGLGAAAGYSAAMWYERHGA